MSLPSVWSLFIHSSFFVIFSVLLFCCFYIFIFLCILLFLLLFSFFSFHIVILLNPQYYLFFIYIFRFFFDIIHCFLFLFSSVHIFIVLILTFNIVSASKHYHFPAHVLLFSLCFLFSSSSYICPHTFI